MSNPKKEHLGKANCLNKTLKSMFFNGAAPEKPAQGRKNFTEH